MFSSVTDSNFDLAKARQEQLELEHQSDTELVADTLRETLEAAECGDLELTNARRLLAASFENVKQHIVESQNTRPRGNGAKYILWLREVCPEVASVIAIQAVIKGCMSRHKAPTFQNIAVSIGQQYVTEVRLKEATKVNPLYMEKVDRHLKDRNVTSVRHIKITYDAAYKKVMDGLRDSNLTTSEVVMLGKFGIDACFKAGLIDLEVIGKGPRSQYLYKLTPEVLHYLLDYNEDSFNHLVSNTTATMLCPPDPWDGVFGGGYLTARRKENRPLLAHAGRHNFKRREADHFTPDKMPQFFDVVNYLQSQSFEYHLPTLELLAKVWKSGGGILGVPATTYPSKPEFPFGDGWDKEEATDDELVRFDAWRASAAEWHYGHTAWQSKLLETSSLVKTMQEYKDRPLWYPVFGDSRGRLYYRGNPNPQGSQIAKAAIHFHRRKALGADGVYWLKVHIANCAGIDDIRFDKRVEWVDQHWDAIVRALQAPQDHPDVWGDEAPLMMFSACYELNEAYKTGSPETYQTGIPVALDATCSGIQHFSALLRDPVGAKHVNLYDVPGPKKQDIYKSVADATHRHLINMYETGHTEHTEPWVRLGVDRDLAKRPVMTKVYGVTLLTVIQYVSGYVSKTYPLERFTRQQNTAMARGLLEGIGAALPAVVGGMEWLHSVARKSEDKDGLSWTLPTGFRVTHRYKKYKDVRVEVKSAGVSRTVVRNYTDEINSRRSTGAISPNFIHSLDAAHLTMTADRFRKKGLGFLGVHDSFATHPCDVGTLHTDIREAFVELYSHDIVGNFTRDTGTTVTPPKIGSFDLNRVKSSEFFFS